MASVSHQGMTSPAARSRRRYRPIRCQRARTSGPSACELILRPSGLHLATESRRLSGASASSAGKFFLKASTASSFSRSGAAAPRSWRSRAPSTRARPWSRRARWRTSPRATAPVLAPPAHDAVDRRDRAGLNNLRQCAAVIGVELRGCARLPIDQPVRSAGVEAQHPVAICRPRRRSATRPGVDLGQRQQTTALGRVPGPLREAPQ